MIFYSQICIRPEEGYCSICWEGCQDTINTAPPNTTPATNSAFVTDDGRTQSHLPNVLLTIWGVNLGKNDFHNRISS